MPTFPDLRTDTIPSAVNPTIIHTSSWTKKDCLHPWPSNPSALTTRSTPISFTTGTGASIFTSTLLPALESATSEVILCTCFWAPSPTLVSLRASILRLNARSLTLSRQNGGKKIRLYICLSSRSLWQKLFHTSSPNGYTYPPSTWSSRLGLPGPEDLTGLEVRVESLFFRPFSVLHSKYLIVDRKRVYFPSCNVSWEEWLECCVGFEGPVVEQALEFWRDVWRPRECSNIAPLLDSGTSAIFTSPEYHRTRQPTLTFPRKPLQTAFLPHPHHSRLSLSIPLPYPLSVLLPHLHPRPPPTLLTTALLHLFSTAQKSLTLLTPNLTALPVYQALLAALRRGVDVSVITNRKMMVLEQLLTAGSVTEWWVWSLARAHRRMRREAERRAREGGGGDGRKDVNNSRDDPAVLEDGPSHQDAEAQIHAPGKLFLAYFRPFPDSSNTGSALPAEGEEGSSSARAVKTHIKLTVVDGEWAVLGSGNMDRASWYTSQEVGVMVEGREVVGSIWGAVERELEGRVEEVYNE